MSILQRARARQQAKPAIKPHYTYCWKSRQWYLKGGERPVPVAPEPTPVATKAVALPIEAEEHKEGDPCPHCGGSGRYLIHTRRELGKCFRCDGKGVLDAKDLAFFHRRVEQDLPLNRIFGGALAA